jgi:hypothetical protein
MRIIDGDTHINEPMEVFERFLEEPYRARRPILVKDTFGLTRIVFEGRLYPEPRLRQVHTKKIEGTRMGGTHPGASDPKARLEALEMEGIDVQVIYGSFGLAISSIVDRDMAVAMSRACNDYYADFCSVAPDRFKVMSTLPLQDIPAAVDEARRAVTELGHVGLTMPPNVGGKNLDHPDFYPIYEEAQRLDVPITFHWGNGAYMTAAGTERFDTHFMTHAIGHPFEQMIALSCVVCGGVLERFPALRVAFLEAGAGWVPYWLERLEEHYERRSGEMPLMKKEPIEYIKDGNCYFATEPGEKLLPVVISDIGDDQLMFTSDYPHTDSKFPESVKFVRDRADISEGTKEKLLSTTPARYYGLGAAKAGKKKSAAAASR